MSEKNSNWKEYDESRYWSEYFKEPESAEDDEEFWRSILGDTDAGKDDSEYWKEYLDELKNSKDNSEYWREYLAELENGTKGLPAEEPQKQEPTPQRQEPEKREQPRKAERPQDKRGSRQGRDAKPRGGAHQAESSRKKEEPKGGQRKADAPQRKNGAARDFKVDFNFEDEYESPEERAARERAIKPRREKRSGCLGGVLYVLFVLCAALALAIIVWIAAVDVLGLGEPSSIVEVEIPREFDAGDITDVFYDAGLIKHKALFNFYAGFSHVQDKIDEGTIKGGKYQLNTNYDYRALVHGITTSGSARVETTVTIPEGYTVRQIFELLAANSVCFEEDLWNAAANGEYEFEYLDESTLGDRTRLEGFLFPDTYKFYVNDRPERVISKMLENFKDKLTDEYVERAAELGYSVRDVLTMASMIEREAANDEERPTIASVIYNRLNSNVTNGYLQIDATIYYAIDGTDQEFSTDIDSPYNTYKYPGLIPGPIANPGEASIKAVLYPESTNYYYYALGTDGVHHFFNSYDSFLSFVNSNDFQRVQ